MTKVERHLQRAGYLDLAEDLTTDGLNASGRFPVEVFDRLMDDERFANGELHALHDDVGEHRHDFRGYRNAFGAGSLQIVMDRKTGRFHADVDKYNPYQDVSNFLGHAFGEVVPNWFKRVFVLAFVLYATPATAQAAPGCINGRLEDPRAYFFALIARAEGTLAPDWPAVLINSGIPPGLGPGEQANPAVHYGITQQIGASGPRAVLFLPTDAPDSNGYYTRQVLVIDGEGRWTWIDRFAGGPAYAPRPCAFTPAPPAPVPPPPGPPTVPSTSILDAIERLSAKLDAEMQRTRVESERRDAEILKEARETRSKLDAVGGFVMKYIGPAVAAFFVGKEL